MKQVCYLGGSASHANVIWHDEKDVVVQSKREVLQMGFVESGFCTGQLNSACNDRLYVRHKWKGTRLIWLLDAHLTRSNSHPVIHAVSISTVSNDHNCVVNLSITLWCQAAAAVRLSVSNCVENSTSIPRNGTPACVDKNHNGLVADSLYDQGRMEPEGLAISCICAVDVLSLKPIHTRLGASVQKDGVRLRQGMQTGLLEKIA